MTIIDSFLQILKEEIEKVFKREAEDSKYMNQTILGCRWRAFWGVFAMLWNSFPRLFKLLWFKIAEHRYKVHHDDKITSMNKAYRSMSVEDKELSKAETQAFWSNG